MKKLLVIGVFVFFHAEFSQVRADDVEIYFTEGVESTPYLLLIADFSSNSMSTFKGFDKLEDEMTTESLDQLKEFRTNDLTLTCDKTFSDQVSRWEVYRAVLASVLRLTKTEGVRWSPGDDLDDLLFGDLTVALMASNQGQPVSAGATILQGYGKISESLPELLKDLQAAPCNTQGNNGYETHQPAPKDTYLEWMAYINGFDVVSGMDTEENFAGKTIKGKGGDPDVIIPPNPDYDPNTIADMPADQPIPLPHFAWDSASNNNKYDSPFDEDSCPAFYSIMASMTATKEGQDGKLEDLVAHEFGDVFDKTADMVRWMHDPDADLLPGPQFDDVNLPMQKSWVISDLNLKEDEVCDPNDVLKCGRSDVGEFADAAGTVPLDITDAEQLEADLISIFGEVLSVSSSFVSASVPVNVFNQTESLDNIYTALFEAQNTRTWPGNIKKLRLVDNDGDGAFDDIVDVNGGPGFETSGSNKGRIYYSALTYWTDPDELTGSFGDDPNQSEFIPIRVDGRVVERGGAGQQVPGQIANYDFFIGTENNQLSGLKTSRTVFVESATLEKPNSTNYSLTGDNLDDFDATTTMATNLQGPLDANDVTEANELIWWGRGMDIDAAPGDPNTAAREWITGDSIHSRPFALNYGDTDGGASGYDPNNPDIKILFGTGNGSFHVVENTSSTRLESGRELFAYYPRETLSQLRRRRLTGDGAKIDNGFDMRYGVDGEPVVLTVDANSDQSLTSDATSGDEAYVFFGLRRGGFSYHALDVIDPAAPKLQWKITHTRDDDASSEFDELGLTFSTPRVTKVGYGDKIVDALVFAGGYYGGWDPNDPGATSQIGKDNPSGGADKWGNAIFIVDARSGDLIWKVSGREDVDNDATVTTTVTNTSKYIHKDMDHSIPSDVTILENDAGVLHRIYVGDTGGNVWRVDTPSAACGSCSVDQRENWFASRLGDLSGGSDIRFFHAPDVVEVKDETTGKFFDGVLIQGGNRADPLDQRHTAVQNYLYYMRDYDVVSGAGTVIKEDGSGDEVAQYDSSSLIDRTECIDGDEASCNAFGDNVNGWKIKLGSPGEKGLSTPLVDFGRIFSSTYVPGSSGVCGKSPEGNGKLYVTSLTDGTAVGNQRSYELGPGIPPSPVIIGDAIWLPGGGVDADLDGDGETDDLLTKSFTQRLIPIYWREPGIDDL